MTNSDVLDSVFKISDNLQFTISNDGIVTISEKQDHWIQNLFRKLKIKIPNYKNIELDEYGSYVFSQIDGNKTVKEIGQYLEKKFGENVNPLYERLLMFLNHIEVNCNYIERIK